MSSEPEVLSRSRGIGKPLSLQADESTAAEGRVVVDEQPSVYGRERAVVDELFTIVVARSRPTLIDQIGRAPVGIIRLPNLQATHRIEPELPFPARSLIGAGGDHETLIV